MKIIFYLLIFTTAPALLFSQAAEINGNLSDAKSDPVIFANIALYNGLDSTLIKVEPSNEDGLFTFNNIDYGRYFMKVSYVGFHDFIIHEVNVDKPQINLGRLTLAESAKELQEVVVSAQRRIVEVYSDRMVFNVQGTINSVGDNGLDLLRKAPGVLLDNNDNISVLGRSGVLVYVDGKRLPLSGEELANYLQNLVSEQIDRIDIISNPGSKYEAQGNAGIIDIKLKKDKNLGGNGNLALTASKGIQPRANISANGNFRNKIFNSFGSLGYNYTRSFMNMDYDSYQNDYFITERNRITTKLNSVNYRAGIDFFVSKYATLGVLVTGNNGNSSRDEKSLMSLYTRTNPDKLDSTLIATNISDRNFDQHTYNINYALSKNQATLNIDADFGRYLNKQKYYQPNNYFDPSGEVLLNSVINEMNTPSDIKIISFKTDYEKPMLFGQLGLGVKVSKVISDNTFLYYDVVDGVSNQNNSRSNKFKYDENVYAGYLNYNAKLGEKWGITTGVRLEQTETKGDLTAFDPSLQQPAVNSNYLSVFPSLGFSYQMSPINNFNFNAGRRINRPDYNVLNPFKMQVSELSFRKGNPFLKPEIVNNAELGYTLMNKYNFKVSYSRTKDQITRLIGPDDFNPKASYISWDNLAHQDVWSANASLPIDINKWWNLFANLSCNYLDNQADYGNGAIVDVQAFSYNFYGQNTFQLGKGFKGEISGNYSGPGVWGGVFKYDASYGITVGIQKKFFDNLNVKLNMSDITNQLYWSGISNFNGLVSSGSGRWDSRRVALSINYDFGNSQIKSRKRNTGLESEARRVGGGDN
ncbi:MAG: TonB-dependent receptor [Saprospiraceae bacterium]|jgi:iron complex outermembrane receptor protein|uniref:TonB-dependent receptor domain-containing protein n=1 Tax=Candidatus Brachybacter algidus TaxID=2982024 RepID=UPI001B761FC7|nr:TonB-dependent receptor [Candidatus Brachybacter algidus]MBP7305858.1 TonB-dependent receptor [Saprospiraceae bacterium]MBK7601983.1 TonB-dependent receptor [Candidatus Brachybacter algidus]MBK9025092.1 TonB-dependent receptor [Candidatus Brachybacter algidus]MBK9398678.1 TonB-dependent receptor [Candidatus Brachybacter algidus]MBK9552870.1 TonB-dependent receptor [Candidatus Brachybacter algidus]